MGIYSTFFTETFSLLFSMVTYTPFNASSFITNSDFSLDPSTSALIPELTYLATLAINKKVGLDTAVLHDECAGRSRNVYSNLSSKKNIFHITERHLTFSNRPMENYYQ